MKRRSLFTIVILICVSLSVAQDKAKKVAPQDTLVSRKEMIAKIHADMDRVRKDAENTLLILRGQLSAFEEQTADSIRVRK
jgi:hypothetical protein